MLDSHDGRPGLADVWWFIAIALLPSSREYDRVWSTPGA